MSLHLPCPRCPCCHILISGSYLPPGEWEWSLRKPHPVLPPELRSFKSLTLQISKVWEAHDPGVCSEPHRQTPLLCSHPLAWGGTGCPPPPRSPLPLPSRLGRFSWSPWLEAVFKFLLMLYFRQRLLISRYSLDTCSSSGIILVAGDKASSQAHTVMRETDQKHTIWQAVFPAKKNIKWVERPGSNGVETACRFRKAG